MIPGRYSCSARRPAGLLLAPSLLIFGIAAWAPAARAAEPGYLCLSGGFCAVGGGADDYSLPDGHRTDAELSFGVQLDFTAGFCHLFLVGARLAVMDLAPDPDSYFVVLPGLYFGVRTPRAWLLPELWLAGGLALGKGKVGASHEYAQNLGMAFMGTVGARWVMPESTLLSGWGLYADATWYSYIVGSIPCISVGILRLFD